jgi:hypothetical protein
MQYRAGRVGLSSLSGVCHMKYLFVCVLLFFALIVTFYIIIICHSTWIVRTVLCCAIPKKAAGTKGSADLTIGLGDTLDLVLLLDGVAIGGSAGSVDDLVSQALSNGLDVAEG